MFHGSAWSTTERNPLEQEHGNWLYWHVPNFSSGFPATTDCPKYLFQLFMNKRTIKFPLVNLDVCTIHAYVVVYNIKSVFVFDFW
jgi:hypothetical protein